VLPPTVGAAGIAGAAGVAGRTGVTVDEPLLPVEGVVTPVEGRFWTIGAVWVVLPADGEATGVAGRAGCTIAGEAPWAGAGAAPWANAAAVERTRAEAATRNFDILVFPGVLP